MRKKLSYIGAIRLFVLMALVILIMTVIKQISEFANGVGAGLIVIAILLLVLDVYPLVTEDAPEIFQLNIEVNGVKREYDVKQEDLDKLLYMIGRTEGRFEIIGFDRLEEKCG